MHKIIRKTLPLFFLAVLTNESHALYAPYGVFEEEGFLKGIARQHPIYYAVSECKQAEVIKYLNEGVSPNQGYIKGQEDYQEYKYTPLYYLIRASNCPANKEKFTQQDGGEKLKIARTLLDHGANPNAKWDEYSGYEKESTYPLNYAIDNFRYEIEKKSDEYNQNSVDYERQLISLLLAKGADVHLKGYKYLHDSTPLEILLGNSDDINHEKTKEMLSVAEELISKGATIESKLFVQLLENNENGKYNEILEFLIEHGFDVNSNIYGESLINRMRSSPEAIKFLLAHGAKQKDLDSYTQESLMEQGVMLSENATIGETIGFYLGKVWDLITSPIVWVWDSATSIIGWIWDFVTSGTGLAIIAGVIAFIVGFKKFKSWNINRKRESAKIVLNKMSRRISEIQSRLNNIDCSYFPQEAQEVSRIKVGVDEISSQLKGLEGKEEEYDASAVKPKVEEAEKSSKAIAEKVRSLQEELSKLQSIFERCKEDYESTNRSAARISEEIHSYEGFEGVETYQNRIREHGNRSSEVQERINRVQSFDEMKRFVDQEVAGIENMVQTFRNFENEWDRFKDGLKGYQPLMQRTHTLREKSERSGSECSSIGEESARELQKVFEVTAEECRTMVREISGSTHREEVSYYEDRIRTLEQQYNDAQREFNEKFKAVAEFKRLSSDREKKEWILKNGYISWFFNDLKIAEKYRKFDSMEEKFKYLIEVNEKLRFLDLEKERPGEGKTTWTVFMHEIRSDMNYEEMKALLKSWQTDVKFKQKKESWQKKLNEANIEDKKLLSITNEFVGIRL